MNPFITIKDIKRMLARKEITPAELVAFYQARIKKHNQKLNAVLEVFETPDRPRTGNPKALLEGIPGLIKDNICQKGRITSAGSKILANYKAPYPATVVENLKDEGAILIGRANMDEFAMGGSGEFSAYGATKNPWNLAHSPGGSSAGSAAAVSAGLAPFALGTETGGSIRQPAAFTNLVGLYPTYGLFSRYGLLAFASSTDQAGPLTRTVYDNALVASALSGHDPKDSTTLPEPARDYTKKLDGHIPEGLIIGVIRDGIEHEGMNPEVVASFKQAIDTLERMGARIKYIDLPNLRYGIAVYFIVSRAEAASNLARFDGSLYGNRVPGYKDLEEMYKLTRSNGFGTEVKRRILVGNYVLSAGHRDAFYEKANQVRALMRSEFENAFNEVDVLASPTASTLPFELNKESNDPLAMYLADYFTVTNCITGMPGLSVPCGFSKSGLPIGFQFIGPKLSEELLYRVAYAYEQHTDFHLKTPQGFE